MTTPQAALNLAELRARHDALCSKSRLTRAENTELTEVIQAIERHESADKAFRTGDRVSWDVGSDVYVGKVERATQTRLYVIPDAPGGTRIELFTRRQDGFYRRHGASNYSRLRHGGEPYLSREF